jgi:hypothetical protein
MEAICVDDAEMRRRVQEQGLEVLHPEYGTEPRVYYRNLARWRSVFIGGSVAATRNGVNDCVAGARVALQQGGKTLATHVTDAYGDFRFARLAVDSGSYGVVVSADGCEPETRQVELRRDSVVLGAIELKPRASVAPKSADRPAIDPLPVN